MFEFEGNDQQTKQINESKTNAPWWIEYLKSKFPHVMEAKLEVYLGSNKVNEQVVSRATLSQLWDDDIGQEVQQALENHPDRNVSARILVDGEKVGHIKAGEILGPPSLIEASKQVVEESFIMQQPGDTAPQVGQVKEIAQEVRINQVQAIPSETAAQEQSRQELPQPEAFVPPSWNDIRSLIAQQQQSPEVVENVIFQMMVYQTTRINQLEQKLESMSRVKPVNTKVNKWLDSLQQQALGSVKNLNERAKQIPQDIGKFLGNVAAEIQTNAKVLIKDTRAEIVDIASDIKSSSKRMIADVAGNALNAGTRFLAERFGEDNGAGVKAFKGDHLVIMASNNHSGIYSKEGKELVKDGQFVSAVTPDQLSRIAQVSAETQKLAQSETQVKVKALRA